MNKKEPTLKELMDAARKQKQQEQVFEDFFDEFDAFDDGFPDAPQLQIEDLDQWLDQLMRELEPYHFSAEDQKTIREFLTLHGQTKLIPAGHPEEKRVYYNLMICCEEPEAVRRFAQTLSIALGFPWRKRK